MKKILTSLILVCILISASYCVNAESEKEKYVDMSVEENNDEVSVIVNVTGNEKGIIGMQGTLDYDKDALELVNKESLIDNFTVTAFNESTGTFLVEIDDESFYEEETYIHDSQDVLKLTFKSNGKSNITMKNIKLVDGEINTIESADITYSSKSAIVYIVIAACVLVIGFMLVKMKKIRKLIRSLGVLGGKVERYN